MTVNSIAMGVSLTFSRSRKAMHQSHYYFRSCCNFFYLQTNTNLTNVVCNPIVMLTGFFRDCGTGMTYKIIRHTCLKASVSHFISVSCFLMHTCYSKLKLNYSAFFLFSQYLSNFNVKKLFTDKSQGPKE